MPAGAEAGRGRRAGRSQRAERAAAAAAAQRAALQRAWNNTLFITLVYTNLCMDLYH